MSAHDIANTRRPFVSIVIPTIGRTSRLSKVLAGLCQDNFQVPYEIIAVVDGANELADGVVWTDSRCVSSVALATGRRVGVARARNTGIAVARGSIVAFLDDDTIPCPGWMNMILRTLDGGGVKAVVGLVDSPPVWTAVDRLRDLGYKGRHLLTQREPSTESIARQSLTTRHDLTSAYLVDYLSGGNCAVLRAALLEVGGFDERLLVGQDRELGRRLLAGGHPVAYESRMRVLHFNKGTLPKLACGRFYSGYFNVLSGEHRNPWRMSQQLGLTWLDLYRRHSSAVFFAAVLSNLSYSVGRLWACMHIAFGHGLERQSSQDATACPLPFVPVTAERFRPQCKFFDVTQPTALRQATGGMYGEPL